ncbi:MAG TPA: hypothetical protein PLB81_07540 [Deltaproteobacteria bacterium]|nr:hypothetical protein [Deltaproteobacteria bacterium]
MQTLDRMERDCLVLHGLFAVIAVIVLLTPGALPVGPRLSALVIGYNLALPIAGLRRGYPEWVRLWLFLLPLSILQIFPDWFLAAQLNVLVFPDTGSIRIGAVPAFMGGLWVIPLFITVYLGQRLAERTTRNYVILAVCLSSFLLFVGSETVLWAVPIWYARDVTTVAHVALYLIVPEILFGLSAFLAYEASRGRAVWFRLGAAFTVMIIYLGNLCFFYFVMETLL